MNALRRPLLLILAVFLDLGRPSPTCSLSPTILLPLGSCTVLAPDQTDVHSWGFRLRIPDVGDICAVPSTVLSYTFLTTEALCIGDQLVDAQGLNMTRAQCRSRRGGFIPRSRPLPGASIDGLDDANPNWKALGNDIRSAAQATFKIAHQSITMTVGLITTGQQSSASHLGLASGSVFLQTLKDKGLIATRSFGLNVGSQSVELPRPGSLTLGGYGQASFGSLSVFEYNITTEMLQNRACPLQVLVDGLNLTAHSANSTITKEISGMAEPVRYCIEPYDNLFRFPHTAISQAKEFFNTITKYQGEPVAPARYQYELANLEPGLVYPKSAALAFNGSMRLSIRGGLTVDIPIHEMQRPLRGLDSDGNVIVNDNFTELQIYNTEAPGFAPVLGKAFLSQVHLFVDYESGKFMLAPLSPQVTGPVPVSSVACTSSLSPSDKGLLGVGCVLGALIVIVVLVVYFLYQHRPPSSKTGIDAGRKIAPANTRNMTTVEDKAAWENTDALVNTVAPRNRDGPNYYGGGDVRSYSL